MKSENIIYQLSEGTLQIDSANYHEYWTYMNSLGTGIIEYADFIVNEQTLERITGEWMHTYLSLHSDVNQYVGITTDAIGSIPHTYLSSNTVLQTPFSPQRPYPTEDGVYFCILPFFFTRSLHEVFPLMSCNEGQVRIDIKLKGFEECVRNFTGYRVSCKDTPLNSQVSFQTTSSYQFITNTISQPPAFRDFRLITGSSFTMGNIRNKYLHQPFEQKYSFVQLFHFEEPLKYLVSKPNNDKVEIQLPIECNHPIVELLWVFRRKAVVINNEWANFTPSIGLEMNPDKKCPPWLDYAILRMNGSEVISADGDWFRDHIAKKHKGGWTSYESHIYGYSFSEMPENNQPSGTANASRVSSVTLQLRVNNPIVTDINTLQYPCHFEVGGWEVFVYAVYYNWLRFENGICNKLFSS